MESVSSNSKYFVIEKLLFKNISYNNINLNTYKYKTLKVVYITVTAKVKMISF